MYETVPLNVWKSWTLSRGLTNICTYNLEVLNGGQGVNTKHICRKYFTPKILNFSNSCFLKYIKYSNKMNAGSKHHV
jgi:hypothetical protein